MLLPILYPYEGNVSSEKVIAAANDAVANGYDGYFDGKNLLRAIEITEDNGDFTFTQQAAFIAANN